MTRRSSSSRRRAPSAAALFLLAAAAVVAPQAASARPLRDPNNPIPAPGTHQAAQEYNAGVLAAAGPGGQHPQQMQQMQQQPMQPAYYNPGNYAVAGGATIREGYAASATGSNVAGLWPQAMANSARVGGGPFSGPFGGYGGGMYGRNGFFYGRDRTNWPNHSAGSMAIAGGQTAAIASTGVASAAAFGGRRR